MQFLGDDRVNGNMIARWTQMNKAQTNKAQSNTTELNRIWVKTEIGWLADMNDGGSLHWLLCR